MNKVYVILINYKGDVDTLECLESMKKLKMNNFELHTVVVDNFPAQPIKIDESKFKDLNLKVIYNSENLGFTGGNNTGINFALENGADYIVILNNDTIVDSNFISDLVRTAIEKGDGIFAPKIYFAKGYEFHKDRYKESEKGKVIWYAGGVFDWNNVYGSHKGVDELDHGQYDKLETTEFASGCCFLITKNALGKIGTFDNNYFLYYEDADLSQRAKKAGLNAYYVPKAVIWHKNAGSTGGSGSPLQDYYITRNRLYFGMKYASLRTKLALFRESIRYLISGRKSQKEGVADYFLGRMGRSDRFK